MGDYMIEYFKELDDKENQYLRLIKENKFKSYIIDINHLPLEFYKKYKNLFLELADLDVLYKKQLDCGQTKLFWNSDVYQEYGFENFVSMYINGYDISDYSLTPEGVKRLDFLVKIFKSNYNEYNFEQLYDYILSLVNLFVIDSRPVICHKNQIKEYLSSTMIVAKYQNKLSKNVEKIIIEALNELKKYKIEIPIEPYNPINLKLPNCWYITPYKHLYNSMGPKGHKEANLIYPFYYDILRDKKTPNPLAYFKSIQKTKDDGFITYSEYDSYLNLKYNFPCIYPDFYYNLDAMSKVRYRITFKRSYNPTLVQLIIGIKSAHAGLYNFFNQLKRYSDNYERDIELIKKLNFDDILVRCCGFHKISSLPEKIITTSCVNYEEEFREYIEKGWKIDFIPPIIINKDLGTIEEYPEEFLIIRRILKN